MARAHALAALGVLAIAGCATAIGLHDLIPPPLPPDDPAVCARTQGIAPTTLPFCTATGACWKNPAPTGANLYHAWGACGDAWIVGKGGELIHWDGSTWTEMPAFVTADLFRISGSSPTDVWFAGDLGTMLHWNGTTVSAITLPDGIVAPMIAVYAATPSDAWALGSTPKGTIFLHWDGTSWSHVADRETTGIAYNALWGSSATDVWVVGAAGAASHWDGKVWRESHSTMDSDLTHVWGSGPTDVWATSESIQHWDGNAWTVVDVSLGDAEYPTEVWGGSAADVWVATDTTLRHFDGMSWHAVPGADDAGTAPGSDVISGAAIGSGQTFVVGKSGLIIHGSGESLTRVNTGFRNDVAAIYGSSSDDVWLVGAAGMVKHWDGSQFQVFGSSTADQNTVWGINFGPVWGAGDDGIRELPIGRRDPVDGTSLQGIWGADQNVVWAVGVTGTGPAIYRYDDAAAADAGPNDRLWVQATIDIAPGSEGVAGFNAVHGTGPNDIWAVGNAGGVAHWDGKTWKLGLVGAGTPLLFSVLAVAPNDVWAAGTNVTDRTNRDVILHYDGTRWTPRPGPFGDDCSCVPTCELACASRQRLWTMGTEKNPWLASSRGAIHQWDGAAWKPVAAGAGVTQAFYGTLGNNTDLVLWSGGPGGAVRTIRP